MYVFHVYPKYSISKTELLIFLYQILSLFLVVFISVYLVSQVRELEVIIHLSTFSSPIQSTNYYDYVTKYTLSPSFSLHFHSSQSQPYLCLGVDYSNGS